MSHGIDRRQFLGRHLVFVGGAGLLAGGMGRALWGAEAAPAPAPQAAGELRIGAASISITPDKPVALHGQMHTRIGKTVESPVTAAALALEGRRGGQVGDQAIFVACDLAVLRGGILEKTRQRVKDRLPGFDVNKLILTATHTHSAPVSIEGVYELPKDGVMRPAEYFEFLLGRLTEVIVKAWQSRAPGLVGWGLGHAVVAQNRRALYADGRAEMYGKTDRPDFRGIEGYEDHAVQVLLFWDKNKKLLATAVDVACPAQEVEGNLAVSADYWGEVRKLLRGRHGEGLTVLGWIGAAGDQSPHLMFRKAAEERMRQLRGLTRLEEIARRIDHGWQEAFEEAVKEQHADVPLTHKVQTVQLPRRTVTDKEYAQAKEQIERLSKDPRQRTLVGWHGHVIEQYERQKAGRDEPYPTEVHAIRLGDVAIATNSFELFTDYGIQIQAQSPALQTFVIQLAGEGTYLPSERAVGGGGYSAIPQSNRVGPEGGQVLVDRTVELLDSMWKRSKG